MPYRDVSKTPGASGHGGNPHQAPIDVDERAARTERGNGQIGFDHVQAVFHSHGRDVSPGKVRPLVLWFGRRGASFDFQAGLDAG